MKPFLFEDVVSLLNQSQTTYIYPEPERFPDSSCLLYRGEHRLPINTYKFRIVYLPTRVTQEELARAAKELKEKGELHLVYAPSLQNRLESIKKTFQVADAVRSTKEFLTTFIKSELGRYISAIKTQRPKYYVDAPITVPAGFTRKIPNPLLNFLREPDPHETGAVVALLAEPGQGKTYMSRYLGARLAEISENTHEFIPILIDSSQWQRLSLDDLGSLFKTITNSFRHYSAPIGWMEGHEDRFLDVTLRAGMFRIIFDGFDEYILKNKGTISPADVLKAIKELAESTNAKIIITSRTSFWEMNFSDPEVGPILEEDPILYIYQISPFNLEHARNYYARRLSDKAKAERAVHLFGELRNQDPEFVGRGFVLDLIADFVERDSGAQSPAVGSGPLRWLIDAMCERETLRQDLPLSREEQVEALKQLAFDLATGEPSDSTVLEYAIGATRPDLSHSDIIQCVDKMKSHPIIEYKAAPGVWSFRQEQAHIFFLAEFILSQAGSSVRSLVRSLRLKPGVRQDLAAALVSFALNSKNASGPDGCIQQLVANLSEAPRNDSIDSETRALSATILLRAVDRLKPGGSSHRDRTDCLLRMSGKSAIINQDLSDTIARFDFKGVEFVGCTFAFVTWANCQFDEATRFVNCQLEGNTFMHCRGLGLADFGRSVLDSSTRAWVSNASVAEGKRAYSPEDLRNDISAVIKKFIGRAGLGLKSIAEANLQRGSISLSRHRMEILKCLVGSVLETHHISGTSDKGYNVRPAAEDAGRFFAANNVFTGPLADAFEHLEKTLCS